MKTMLNVPYIMAALLAVLSFTKVDARLSLDITVINSCGLNIWVLKLKS
jgi:hypothetical protein